MTDRGLVTDETGVPLVTDGELVVCARCAAMHIADTKRLYGFPHNAELSEGRWGCQDSQACASRAATMSEADLEHRVAAVWEHVLAARLRETGDQLFALRQRHQIAVERRDEAIRAAVQVGIPRQRIAEWTKAAKDEVVGLDLSRVDATG